MQNKTIFKSINELFASNYAVSSALFAILADGSVPSSETARGADPTFVEPDSDGKISVTLAFPETPEPNAPRTRYNRLHYVILEVETKENLEELYKNFEGTKWAELKCWHLSSPDHVVIVNKSKLQRVNVRRIDTDKPCLNIFFINCCKVTLVSPFKEDYSDDAETINDILREVRSERVEVPEKDSDEVPQEMATSS